MIVTKHYSIREDGVELVITYSDRGMMIEQDGTGARYAEAVEPASSVHEYTETDEPVEPEIIDPEEALSIILGGVT